MLGSGWSSFTEVIPSISLGAGWSSFTEVIPSMSLGIGYESLSEILQSVFRGPQFRANDLTRNVFTQPLFSVLATKTGINLLSAATTTLFTTTAGVSLIQGIILIITTGTSITGDATVSIGINPSTTNLFVAQELITVRNLNDVYSFLCNRDSNLKLNWRRRSYLIY